MKTNPPKKKKSKINLYTTKVKSINMTQKKNTLTKKEKLYILSGVALIIIILAILGIIAYNNLFSNNNQAKGTINMNLKDSKITTNDETTLQITVKNTGKTLMEGELEVIPDDMQAVNVTHPDPSVLNINLYPDESITRVLSVRGQTKAIRTDYKIFARITHENETVSSNEIILTVTQE